MGPIAEVIFGLLGLSVAAVGVSAMIGGAMLLHSGLVILACGPKSAGGDIIDDFKASLIIEAFTWPYIGLVGGVVMPLMAGTPWW